MEDLRDQWRRITSRREPTNVVSIEERRARQALGDLNGLSFTATKFDPGQMSDWERAKPWNLTQAEAEAQAVPGWWGKSSRGTESASWEKGYIRPSPEFFTYQEETRRAIAYHEAGHAMLEAAGGLRAIEDPLGLIDLPGGQALSYNAEEIIAEAYSVLWTEPEWFERMGAQQIRDITIGLARKAGFPLPTTLRTASLDTKLYWRTHPAGRPFTPDDATSTTFQGGVRSTGYSCFDDPWHLWLYLDAMRWYEAAKSQDIIGFTGERIGTGNDGEDLVMPDMRTVQRMPFSDFERQLQSTSLPPTPTFGPGWDGYSSWKTLARTWLRSGWSEGDDPLVDRILKQAMPSWRGLVNGPVWTEYPGVIIVDKGGGNRQSYEVYLEGEWVARVARLDEAKAYIEARLGQCIFRRIKQDPIKSDHYWFGVQEWFGDPSTIYSAVPV